MKGKKTIVRGKVAKPMYSSIEQLDKDVEKRERKYSNLIVFDGSKFFTGSGVMFLARQFVIGLVVAALCSCIHKFQWSILGSIFLNRIPIIVRAIAGMQWYCILIGFMAMFSDSFISIGIAGFISRILINSAVFHIPFPNVLVYDLLSNVGYCLGMAFLGMWTVHDTSDRLITKIVRAFPITFFGMGPSLMLGGVFRSSWDGFIFEYDVFIPWMQSTLGMIVGMILAHMYVTYKKGRG